MGKTYTKLLRHQVKKLARRAEKGRKDGSSEEEEDDDEEEEEEEAKREPKWSDKGATISDKNAVKEFPGTKRRWPVPAGGVNNRSRRSESWGAHANRGARVRIVFQTNGCLNDLRACAGVCFFFW